MIYHCAPEIFPCYMLKILANTPLNKIDMPQTPDIALFMTAPCLQGVNDQKTEALGW